MRGEVHDDAGTEPQPGGEWGGTCPNRGQGHCPHGTGRAYPNPATRRAGAASEQDGSGERHRADQERRAQVTATAGGVSRAAWADGGATYLGRSQQIVHFGLSNETLVDVVVTWSDGSATSMPGLSTNQIVTAAPPVFGGAPGEASSDPVALMKADKDAATGDVLLEYTPACDASNHTIYYGQMADIATHGYSHAVCWLGSNGSVRFDPGRDTFFLIVGHNGVVEGSYGLFGAGGERPEATGLTGCEIPQDLTGTCDVP